MWEAYREVVQKYPRRAFEEERRLIAAAQKGVKESVDELVLRHISFVMWRLRRKIIHQHRDRHGEDMLSAAIPVLYQKVKTYDLNYRDKAGSLKPVRFSSYIWKRIDGLAIDYLKREAQAGGVEFNDECLGGHASF